jgi:hypothetical protein
MLKIEASIQINFPADFIEQRELLRAQDNKHIYGYKDQVWIVITKDKEHFIGEPPVDLLRIRSVLSFKDLIELAERYARNLLYLADKTDRVPRLIKQGYVNPNIYVLIMTKVSGVHIFDSKLPSHLLIKAIIDAYDLADDLYKKYGYVIDDLHFGNWLIDEQGKPFIIDLEHDMIKETPDKDGSNIYEVMNLTSGLFPYSNHYDYDDSDEPWSIERNFFVKLYDLAIGLKDVSDMFFDYQMRDPLMKIMAPFLFQTFIQYESSDAKEAFHFTMACLCPRVIWFLSPLKSRKLIDLVNRKFYSLGIKKAIDEIMCFYTVEEGDYSGPDEPQYKFILNGKHIGYSDKKLNGIFICFDGQTQFATIEE